MSTQDETTKKVVKKFNEILKELEHCDEDEQKKKIEEMNKMTGEMNEEEFKSVFTARMFNKINEIIKVKKLTIENLILLLKRISYFKMLAFISTQSFNYSLLCKKLKALIIDEDKKKERMNEKYFIDLCECYISLSYNFPPELLSICIPCLLKVALNKEENEETQNEVEMALLALSNIIYSKVAKELYIKEIVEIMKYHQEHRNLTHLAYQSAWHFLINRFRQDKSLEDVIVNELHFARETAGELNGLSKCVDWKREKEEEKAVVLMEWLKALDICFIYFRSRNEVFILLTNCIVKLFRAAKDKHRKISTYCIYLFKVAAEFGAFQISHLLNGGAVDAVLEEIHEPTLNDGIVGKMLLFFMNISKKLKKEGGDEMDMKERKMMKMDIFEKAEEEGYEDAIAGFHKTINFLNNKFHFKSLNIADYFMNI
ncbi:uncharacterized protein MONOS_18591 [Monocercomonoides exilis]|uniref:uncharacterized protein n=1 Tax=Monocercomonoides exilis TaxID=2049356 RepID=UPI00355A455E|nr:hypothetical protein MONOS_18591 [Monocercomonoides exilis]